jgi:hypothetical protein
MCQKFEETDKFKKSSRKNIEIYLLLLSRAYCD